MNGKGTYEAGLPAQSGLRGKITDSHAAGYGLYDRYWASAGVMNIDTIAINPASATIFLPIPYLPLSSLLEVRMAPQYQFSFKPLWLGGLADSVGSWLLLQYHSGELLSVLQSLTDEMVSTDHLLGSNLRRAKLGTNIAITIGTCDSNTSSITGPTNIACFMPPYTAQINESYWWEILIDRSDPSVNVEFLMVGMRYYAEAASARRTTPSTTSAYPSGVLTPEQCNAVWMTTGDAPAQADVVPENFAQADDIAQIDTNNDGTIDKNEFVAACAKGLVHVPARSNR